MHRNPFKRMGDDIPFDLAQAGPGQSPELLLELDNEDSAPSPDTDLQTAKPLRVSRTSYVSSTTEGDPRLPIALIAWTVLGTVLMAMLVNNFYDGHLLPTKSYIERGEEAIAQQDWPAALGAIQKVEESSRQRPAYLRLLADYLIGTRTFPEILANTLEKLKPSEMFRPEDHLWLCRAWLASNHPDRARAAWEDIPTAQASGLEATQLKIELLKMEGQKREAELIQDSLGKIFADDPAVAVQQASKDSNSSFPELRYRAVERLWQLARRQDAPGLDAIRHLSGHIVLSRSEIGQLLALATSHPAAEATDRLKVLSLLLPMEPDKRETLIQAEVERYRSSGPTVLAQLSSWLSKEKEQDRILQLIPETRWKEQPVLLPLVVQALVDQARWQDLLNTLTEAESKKQFSKALLMNWRAQALKMLLPQDALKPREALQEAILQGNVEKNHVVVMNSARIAEDWQLPDLALQAYQLLAVPGEPNEADLLEKCEKMASLLKDSEALTDAAVRLSELQPNSTEAARRAAYLRLLRGERVETAIGSPTVNIAKGDSTAWLLTALQAWRLGDPPAAHGPLMHITDTLGLGPGERAVMAGLLARTGETARGFQLAEQIRTELLLPEEAAFLNSAR